MGSSQKLEIHIIRLYVDDRVLLADNEMDMQYFMIFRKGERSSNDLQFKYDNNVVEIVSRFSLLCVVCTKGGSFVEKQNAFIGQAQNRMYQMQTYLQSFVSLKPSLVCDIFDKLIHPILSYRFEVWVFNQGTAIERVHLKFCKQLLGLKQCAQNDFIYGELGSFPLIVNRYYRIVKFWLKIIKYDESKFVKICYNMMLNYIVLFPK